MNKYPHIVPSNSGKTKHGYHIPKQSEGHIELGIQSVPRSEEDLRNTLRILSEKQTEQLKKAGLV